MKRLYSLIPILLLCIQLSGQGCMDCSLIDPTAICPTIFDPVCGCNGVTYGNDCNAVNSGVISYYSGECPGSPVDQCVNLTGLDFGLCTAIIGYGMVNGQCVAISGCSTTTIGGVDYTIAFYETLDDCEANCFCPATIPDNDGDGFNNEVDCDDTNPDIYPGAPEICDGIDNNCNDEIDEELPNFTYYLDDDGDGFGVPTDSLTTCSDVFPDGYATNTMDCDDSNPNAYPDAEEIPNNGIDEDCDGEDLISNGLVELHALGLHFYPNPSSNFVTLENHSLFDAFELRVYDLTGKILIRKWVNEKTHRLDCSELKPGIYFLEFETEEFSLGSRLLKI